MAVGAMGGTLLTQSSSSYDRAFSELAAPHLVVVFDGRALTRDQVAATASVPRVISAAGPCLVASVAFEKGARHLSVSSSFSSQTEILAALSAVKVAVPAGAVLGYISYLDSRDSFNFTASLVLTFLLAFAAMALASVAVIVSNVVTGAVLASYREIGIVKALG